jgi:peptidyl-prolyl cis-trans isomerase SurA
MLKKIILLYFSILLIFYSSNSYSIENKILFKIENQIITSLDVNNEYKYLIALNPKIKNSKKNDVINFSKKSIIQEKIKKIEVEKNFNNTKIPEEFLEKIIKQVYTKIGIKNSDDFKEYLGKNNINYEDVVNKLTIEALWNELILIKFSSKVSINKNNLKERINKSNNKYLKSYLMSEIFFEVSNLNNIDDKFLEIKNVIENKSFEFAVLKYSLSSTSSFGGKLDWINESSLNTNIKKALAGLDINDYTKPIIVPGGFLILKINNIKNIKIDVDIEKELEMLVNYERNNQLNQYSKIYFNKIKKNLNINEL